MSKRIILDKNELQQKYVVEKLSQDKTAKYFNCSIDTVVRNLKDYGIKAHKQGAWCVSNRVELSEYQRNKLCGALLGDGSLIKCKNGINAQFTYVSKSKQHVEFVCKDFMEYSYKEGIKKYEYIDKRTKKQYFRYTFRTITDQGFTAEYYRWYKNGIKHIPEDLILNPLICLIWYIGDGSICNSSKNNSQCIKIATNCFDKNEQERILLPQLSDFGARLCKAGKNKSTNKYQYAIYIPKKKMEQFFEFIGECPFPDYKYKWDYKEKFYPSYEDYYEEWKKLYLNGMGYTHIARLYGADNTTVLKYLRKVGIYKRFEGYKQFYKEWEDMFISGMKYYDIAKKYNCCSQTVLHHLRQVNLF